MLILSTQNAAPWLDRGMRVLRDGGSSMDAVEAVIREVEADTREHTVGVGGYPNLAGEVELDACMMRGADRRCGAVGALQGFPHPISVARRVLELTPHVLLVGRGAELFARECGFEPAPTLTPEAAEVWEQRVRDTVPAEAREAFLAGEILLPYVLLASDPQRIHGTVNVIAVDGQGRMANSVSTSGWAWKYPGRLGDSPVPGAGSWCDDRFGAAACTGHGEAAIRTGLARAVVLHLEYGASLEDACRRVLADAAGLERSRESTLVVVAASPSGEHVCLTDRPRGWGCAWMDQGMGEARTERPVVVDRPSLP